MTGSAVRITDSELYRHLWGTEELRAVFAERARLESWLGILTALAAAQSELGIISPRAAESIAREARADRLDLGFAAEETRSKGHSMLGLIHALQRILPPEAGEYVYYGATVQDVTDTWMSLTMKDVGAIVWRDLRAVEELLLGLAARYRDALMAGRTHGQPGAPITFGFKAASWADEVRRHLDRLREGAPRWLVGQLGGAVGNLAFFDDLGPELRKRFCERLGLADPGISWTTSRDRPAEFALVLAMVTATLARIGSEVYQLQRLEIGELREPISAGSVGSITMPHKRNPELSEHLATLSRLVRANAQILLEGMVQEHERDGRGWKAEWPTFPEVCLLTGCALQLAKSLLADLEVDTAAMERNVTVGEGLLASELLLSRLAARVGKHRAQAALQDALQASREKGLSPEEALAASELREEIDLADLREITAKPRTGPIHSMIDDVLDRARQARAAEGDRWP